MHSRVYSGQFFVVPTFPYLLLETAEQLHLQIGQFERQLWSSNTNGSNKRN